MAGKVFRVVKVKTNSQGKKMFNPVGTAILHDSGESGVLFLHILDGELALFAKNPGDRDDADAQPA